MDVQDFFKAVQPPLGKPIESYTCNSYGTTARSSRGTSNLWTHLRSCKKKTEEIKKAIATQHQNELKKKIAKMGDNATLLPHVVSTTMEGEVPFPSSVKMYLNDLLVKWLVAEFLPPNTSESDRFRHLMHVATMGRWLPLKRQTITTRRIPALQSEMGLYLKPALADPRSAHHLAWDHWSTPQGTSHLGILTKTINADWELIVACLGCPDAGIHHSGEKTKEIIQATLASAGIDMKTQVPDSTSDTASNMVACARELGVSWIACFCHVVNLVVGKLLNAEKVEPLVDSARETVTSFRRSNQLWQAFANAATEQSIQVRTLVPPGKTRWSSHLVAFERLIEYRGMFLKVYAEVFIQGTYGTTPDLERLKTVVLCNRLQFSQLQWLTDILKPFQEAILVAQIQKIDRRAKANREVIDRQIEKINAVLSRACPGEGDPAEQDSGMPSPQVAPVSAPTPAPASASRVSSRADAPVIDILDDDDDDASPTGTALSMPGLAASPSASSSPSASPSASLLAFGFADEAADELDSLLQGSGIELQSEKDEISALVGSYYLWWAYEAQRHIYASVEGFIDKEQSLSEQVRQREFLTPLVDLIRGELAARFPLDQLRNAARWPDAVIASYCLDPRTGHLN